LTAAAAAAASAPNVGVQKDPAISIADITTIGWVIWAGWAGVDIDEFPTLKKWEEMMSDREGVKKGCSVPKKIDIKERMKDKKRVARIYRMDKRRIEKMKRKE